jgi:uncharacterized repeat protein (TIGR02543 family)
MMKKAVFFLAAALAALIMAGCPDPNGESSLKPLFKGVASFAVGDRLEIVTANVGDTSTVIVKFGTAALGPGLHYQWRRADSAEGPFTPIEGAADAAQYTFTTDDINKYIMAQVTRGGFDGVVNSPALKILPAGSTTYTVIFKSGEDVLATLEHVVGGYPIPPEDWPQGLIPPEGKVFNGWYNGANLFPQNESVSGNMTLTAQWRNLRATFIVDVDTSFTSEVLGGKVARPASPVRDGYHFEGWYEENNTDEEFNFDEDIISRDIVIIARWAQDLSALVSIGGMAKEGQTLTVTVTVQDAVIADGLSYQWKRGAAPGGTYTAIADQAGSTYTLGAADIGCYIAVTVSRQGYHGGVTSGNILGPVQDAATPEYTVTFNTDGGTVLSPVSVVQGTRVVRPNPDPTKTGSRFGGWYTSSACTTAFNFDDTVGANTTVYAKWIKTWVVTFDTSGGGFIDPLTVDNGLTITRPADPAKTDAAFAGWYSNAACTSAFSFGTAITADTTIYAKWTAWVPVKRLDFEDRTEVIRTSSADSPAPAPAAKLAYDFQRGGTGSETNTWAVSTEQNHSAGGGKSFKWGNITNTEQKVKFDKIFTADDANRTFSISLWVYPSTATTVKLGTFSLSNTNPATAYGTSAKTQMTEAVSASANTWTEVVWEYTHTQADADANITQLAISQSKTGLTLYLDDIVIKAAENNTWRVTFTGASIPDATVTNGDYATRPAVNPARAGYEFGNWYGDSAFGSLFNFNTTAITASRAIYAKWNPTFTGEAVIGGLPKVGATLTASVSSGGQAITEGLAYQWQNCGTADGTYSNIAGAVSAAYTPVGGDQGKFIKVKVTRSGYAGQVTSAATAAIASAAAAEYTVTFNSSGGSAIAGAAVLSGGTVTRPADPVREGYLFDAWYTSAALTTAFNFGTAITANTTLYAKWYIITKKIVFDNLSNFKLTQTPATATTILGREIYEFQRGGGNATSGPVYGSFEPGDAKIETGTGANNNGIWTGNDHTTGSGKSFKWGSVTATSHKVKFDKAFSPADVGRTFKINMWVHSPAANTVKLGAYKLSGITETGYADAPTPVSESAALSLRANDWSNLTWTYMHTDEKVTQLGIGNFGVAPSTATFYIDDIVIAASEVSETVIKTIDFEVSSFVETTDWEKANWSNSSSSNPLAAGLATEQKHGGSKSFKFSGRNGGGSVPWPGKNCAVKFTGVFPQTADNKLYNVSAWVYNPSAAGNWVWLAVYAPGGSNPVAKEITRVEPGWNKIELRGYKHTGGSNTQLGIAQPEDTGRLDAFYIDDIVVTRVGAE